MGDDGGLPLFKGTLDLLILKSLSWEAMHGYGIVSWLESRSGGSLGLDDSAVYQALHRLEGRRLVRARWGRSENNRRARFYELTARGRAALEREADVWSRYVACVSDILAARHPGPAS
ncbi:MAG TPA: PadR family transcriptional regulator [Longimicrobiales bacterium]|nr:PadR family transcriptional regulator [Longimicrobiales bacterium]